MDTQQQEKTAEEKAPRKPRQRPFRFFVVVKHRQVDLETNQPKPAELLEFDDKVSMREKLGAPEYETAEVRVLRGYELTVRAKRSVSIN